MFKVVSNSIQFIIIKINKCIKYTDKKRRLVEDDRLKCAVKTAYNVH